MIEDVNVKNSVSDIKKMSGFAEQFIAELYGKQAEFQIEEVKRSGDREDWIVTVSYYRKHKSPNDLQKVLGILGSRIYKQLTIKADGTLLGISNWYPDSVVAA